MPKKRSDSAAEKCRREKIAHVMREYERGQLHSGPGKKHKATSREQGLAIAYAEAHVKCTVGNSGAGFKRRSR